MPQLPITNFFIDQGDRYIGEKDANNTNVVPSLQYILVNGVFVPVSIANPMPATVSNFPATQPVSGAVTANIGTTNGLALDGTDTTGVTPPAGATGIRGWLSAIYNLFFGGTAKVQASITGSNLWFADKVSNVGTGDAKVTTAFTFNHISIRNTGSVELQFAVGQAVGTAGKTIYVQPGDAFATDISGTDLHYAASTGTGQFAYVLRG